MPTEKEVIAELRELIQQYEAEFAKLQNAPHGYQVVSLIADDRVFLTTVGGQRLIVGKKELVVNDVAVGDWFEATPGADFPYRKLPADLPIGVSAEITRLTECLATVKTGESSKEVTYNPALELHVGDTVRVDPGLSVITAVLEKAKSKAQVTIDKPVTWDDVGGQKEAKLELMEAVELPLKHPDVFARYGKRPPKGVLLSGPPGCGKTLLGRVVASNAHGAFFYVKGPELLNPYVGVTESNIRELFAKARAYKREHGGTAVIFLDEADALLGARGRTHSTIVDSTIVPQFLSEMDGLNESDVLVLLATNRPDQLDPAVVRDGRVDRKVRVGRPTQTDAVDIFKLYLKRAPLAEDPDTLAHEIAHDLYTVQRNLYELHLENGETQIFGLPQLVSGALIEGIVEKATALAIRRELTGGASNGLTQADLANAVEAVYRHNLDLNHHDAMVDHAVPHTIKSIRKLAHAA